MRVDKQTPVEGKSQSSSVVGAGAGGTLSFQKLLTSPKLKPARQHSVARNASGKKDAATSALLSTKLGEMPTELPELMAKDSSPKEQRDSRAVLDEVQSVDVRHDRRDVELDNTSTTVQPASVAMDGPVPPMPVATSQSATPPPPSASFSTLQKAVEYAAVTRNSDGLAEFVARFSSAGISGLRVTLSATREGGVVMKLAGSHNLSKSELDELTSGLSQKSIRRIELLD